MMVAGTVAPCYFYHHDSLSALSSVRPPPTAPRPVSSVSRSNHGCHLLSHECNMGNTCLRGRTLTRSDKRSLESHNKLLNDGFSFVSSSTFFMFEEGFKGQLKRWAHSEEIKQPVWNSLLLLVDSVVVLCVCSSTLHDGKCIYLSTITVQRADTFVLLKQHDVLWLTVTDVSRLAGKVVACFEANPALNSCATGTNKVITHTCRFSLFLPFASSGLPVTHCWHQSLAYTHWRIHTKRGLEILPFQSSPWHRGGLQSLNEDMSHSSDITAAVPSSTHDALIKVRDWQCRHQNAENISNTSAAQKNLRHGSEYKLHICLCALFSKAICILIFFFMQQRGIFTSAKKQKSWLCLSQCFQGATWEHGAVLVGWTNNELSLILETLGETFHNWPELTNWFSTNICQTVLPSIINPARYRLSIILKFTHGLKCDHRHELCSPCGLHIGCLLNSIQNAFNQLLLYQNMQKTYLSFTEQKHWGTDLWLEHFNIQLTAGVKPVWSHNSPRHQHSDRKPTKWNLNYKLTSGSSSSNSSSNRCSSSSESFFSSSSSSMSLYFSISFLNTDMMSHAPGNTDNVTSTPHACKPLTFGQTAWTEWLHVMK